MSSSSDVLHEVIPQATLVERFINVDSRDRNKRIYSNTNDYVLHLKDALYGVKKIELVSAEVPKSEYFIDETNNLLEVLIDPVLFASNAPSGSRERICVRDVRTGLFQVVRVDASTRNSHGVLHDVSTRDDNGDAAVAVGAEYVFNASPTRDIDIVKLHTDMNEAISLVTYSETENNSSGACRLVIARYPSLGQPSRLALGVSFGTEFGFEFMSGTTTQLPVFAQRLCAMDERKFALSYCRGRPGESANNIRVLVGSSGVDVTDTETRISNSNLVGELGSDPHRYAVGRVSASLSVAAFVDGSASAQQTVVVQLLEVDATYAVYPRQRLVLYQSTTTVGSVSIDVNNERLLVATVADETLRIDMVQVTGVGLLHLHTSVYGQGSAASSVNGSSERSFHVDPNAIVRWSSDSYSTTRLMVRRVDGVPTFSVAGNVATNPSIELRNHEFHRIVVEPHPLDPDVPQATLQNVRIFTSQTQGTEYQAVRGVGTSSLLLELDGSVNSLFYGVVGSSGSERGILNITSADTLAEYAFSVFCGGTHDVGNVPYTFSSSLLAPAVRSVRSGYSSPGDVVISVESSTVDVDGVGFLFTSGEIWSFGRGGWTFNGGGGASAAGPGPRRGASTAAFGRCAYLFGGEAEAVTAASGPSVHTPLFSLVASADAVVLRNVRNVPGSTMIFYEVETDATPRYTFASVLDPATSNLHSWNGLIDVSTYFDRATMALPFNSFVAPMATFSNTFDVTQYGTDWGIGPNTADAVYTYSVLLFAQLDANDTSGQLAEALAITTLDVSVVVRDAGEEKSRGTLRLGIGEWTHHAITIDSRTWNSSTLINMTIEFVVEPVFMHSGFVAFRDPELFVDQWEVASAAPVDVIFRGYRVSGTAARMLSSADLELTHSIPSYTLATNPELKNDLWRIVLDRTLARSEFCFHFLDGSLVDRCMRVLSSDIVHDGTVKNGFMQTATVAVSGAGALYESGASVEFGGRAHFRLSSAIATRLRSVGTGDFAFSATVRPRIFRVITALEYDGIALRSIGAGFSTATNVGVTNQHPSVYEEGYGLILSANTTASYDVTLPPLVSVCVWLYVPSTVNGTISVVTLGSLQAIIVRNSSTTELTLDTLTMAIPTDEWFHVAINLNGLLARMTMTTEGTAPTAADAMVTRDGAAGFTVGGGGGFSGNVLFAGLSVLTGVAGDDLDRMSAISQQHAEGLLGSSVFTLFSCGRSSTNLRVYVDASEETPRLVGTCLNSTCTLELPAEKEFDVVFGRHDGVLYLTAGSSDGPSASASAPAAISLGLLGSGDVMIGARTTFALSSGAKQSILDTFSGDMDEIRLLLNDYDASLAYLDTNGTRLRTMVWDERTWSTTETLPLTPRAHASLTTDAEGHLWIFGGEDAIGTCGDLWQLNTTSLAAYHLTGSSLGQQTGVVPPSRSHCAHYADGYFLYVFGGERFPAVGPYQVEGTVVSASLVTGSATAAEDDKFFEGSRFTYLYPAYTSRHAVLLEETEVVWVEIEMDGVKRTVFTHKATNHDALADPIDAYLNVVENSSLPFVESEYFGAGVSVLGDLWRYEINTATWVRLDEGEEVRTTTAPGPRSRCHVHYSAASAALFLLPGGTSAYNGQDLWSFPLAGGVWSLVREYATVPEAAFGSTTAYPGAAPSLYWRSTSGKPAMLAQGVVFTNQLEGLVVEENLHYGIVINGTITVDDGTINLIFQNRNLWDATSVFPGELTIVPVPEGDAFFILTASKIVYAHVGVTNSSITTYDPALLAVPSREIIRVLPDDAKTHTLVQGVVYDFVGSAATTAAAATTTTTTTATTTSVVATDSFSIGSINFDTAPFDSFVTEKMISDAVTPRSLRATASVSWGTLLPNSTPSNVRLSLITATSAYATGHLVYQNQVNNRFGTLADFSFDVASGNFSASNETVFSAQNPTTALATSPALFGRSVTASVTPAGLSTIIAGASAKSTSTLISEVSASGTEICLLNDLQFTASNAKWLVFFVYNNRLRVTAQRSVADTVADAPAQNLVGEVIKYTEPIVVREAVNSDLMVATRCSRIESGELSGELVVAYSVSTATTSKIYFQDLLVSQCDPLTATGAPVRATENFSLIEEVDLISSNASATNFEIKSVSAIALSNFVAFFLPSDRLSLRLRFFVREQGAYVCHLEDAQLVRTFVSPVTLVRVESLDPDPPPGALVRFAAHLRTETTHIVVVVHLVDESEPYVFDHVSSAEQAFDNENPIVASDAVMTADSIDIFSVHEGTTTHVCPITSRGLSGSGDQFVLNRQSFVTRVTPGDYANVTSFVDELNSKLATIDTNFLVTFHDGTTKLTLSNAFSPFRILLNGGFHEIRDESASNGMAYILGFRDFNDIVSASDDNSVTSINRIDLSGRQYLYIFMSSPDGAISSEITSRNKENAFGRIILSVNKGETMFFTNNLYSIVADTSISVLTQLRIRLGRFSQINTAINDGREVFLYNPQGIEHSFSLKVTCALDKLGSGRSDVRLTQKPAWSQWQLPLAQHASDDYTDEDDDYYG